MYRFNSPVCLLLSALFALTFPTTTNAEETKDSTSTTDIEVAPPAPEAPSETFFAETTVTALGRKEERFEVATPVTVIPARKIEELAPDNAADLLRDQPGVEINGVGPNQGRPVIRGQRGLRILFLEDGLRMNNARRQTDFGEITGLVDVDDLAAVEVVRGPMSVLYGSDAIGGVLNLVTRPRFADAASRRSFALTTDLRYGSAGDLTRAHASLAANAGRGRFSLAGSVREADDYESASGSFGELRLDEPVRVFDTGVDDDSLFGNFDYPLGESHSVGLKARRYSAGPTGFGFVDPAVTGAPDDAIVRITYPYQKFDRTTASYAGTFGDQAPVDSLEAHLYVQNNRRQLANDIAINIGPIFPGAPDSSVLALTENQTDLETVGLRGQAMRLLGGNQLLTAGVEGYRDRSTNTDQSTTETVLRFPFPPFERRVVDEDDVANAPNATNESWGIFLQDEIPLGERFKVVAGARYQRVATKADATPGWDVSNLDFADEKLVGAVSLLAQLTPALRLHASYGTAFRAPSIVERLFNGTTPEGFGFQILNPDLGSETGENVDFGMKFRGRELWAEAVWYRSELTDGIVQDFLAPDEIAALSPDLQEQIAASGAQYVVQQRNANRLRYEGFELAAGWRTSWGITLGGNYTRLDAENRTGSAAPVDDQYRERSSFFLHYEPASHRFWCDLGYRHNAATPVYLEPGEPTPAVGDELPALDLLSLGAGVTLFERGRWSHDLSLIVENLTDELYAEASNATFFRPDPGRNYKVSYRLRY